MAGVQFLYGVCLNDSMAMLHVRNACKDEEGFTAQLQEIYNETELSRF